METKNENQAKGLDALLTGISLSALNLVVLIGTAIYKSIKKEEYLNFHREYNNKAKVPFYKRFYLKWQKKIQN